MASSSLFKPETSITSLFSHSQNIHIAHSNFSVYNESRKNGNFGGLELLRAHSALNALVDSNERFDAPRCAEETRNAVTHQLIDWVESSGNYGSMMWLYGGAGAGKSALVQSLAEHYQQESRLAASFFFARTVTGRSDGNTLIPTLSYQLLQAFPEIGPLVEKNITADGGIFSKLRRYQMQKLIVEPLKEKSSEACYRFTPFLIVIDGLDECQNVDVQCDLLHIIAFTIHTLRLPFRFLVASRPESQIVDTFDHHGAFQSISLSRLNLSEAIDSEDDIRKFLRQAFKDICRVHRFARYLPAEWPTDSEISNLVQRSSSHFIYAATAMNYIQSAKHRPDIRLQIILGLSPPPASDIPLAQLDELYTLILSEISPHDISKVLIFFGFVYLWTKGALNIRLDSLFNFDMRLARDGDKIVADLLEIHPGDLELLLDPLRSVVSYVHQPESGGPTTTASPGEGRNFSYRVLHASLFDFLFDSTRSKRFYVNLAYVEETLARYMMRTWSTRQKRGEQSRSDMWFKDLRFFASFLAQCEKSHISEKLRQCMRSLDDVYSRFLTRDTLKNLIVNPGMWTDIIGYLSQYFNFLITEDSVDGGNWHTYHAERIKNIATLMLQGSDPRPRSIPFRSLVHDSSVSEIGETDDWNAIRDEVFGFSDRSMDPLDGKSKQHILSTEPALSSWRPANDSSLPSNLRQNDAKSLERMIRVCDSEQAAFAVLLQSMQIFTRGTVVQPSRSFANGLIHVVYYIYVCEPRMPTGYLSAVYITYFQDGSSVCTYPRGLNSDKNRLANHLKAIQKRLDNFAQKALSEA